MSTFATIELYRENQKLHSIDLSRRRVTVGKAVSSIKSAMELDFASSALMIADESIARIAFWLTPLRNGHYELKAIAKTAVFYRDPLTHQTNQQILRRGQTHTLKEGEFVVLGAGKLFLRVLYSTISKAQFQAQNQLAQQRASTKAAILVHAFNNNQEIKIGAPHIFVGKGLVEG